MMCNIGLKNLAVPHSPREGKVSAIESALVLLNYLVDQIPANEVPWCY